MCKHSVNASTGTCDVIEYLFMLGLVQKDLYGCSEVPGNVAMRAWRMIGLLDHNQHLPTGEEWPYKDAGELYSEAEASKLFKVLLAKARLGSAVMGISGGVPVMLKTWGQNLNFCMSSWFMAGPH